MQYRKKSLTIEATQWLQHGDHPQVQNLPSPEEPGNPYCPICGNHMRRHGLLDGVNGEEIVCPSDYIVNDREGLPYRLNRGEFESQYEPYVRAPRFAEIPASDLEVRKSRRQRDNA